MGPIEYYYLIPKERGLDWTRCRGSLSYKDSNLDKQDQNLLCYHYTIGQSVPTSTVDQSATIIV